MPQRANHTGRGRCLGPLRWALLLLALSLPLLGAAGEPSPQDKGACARSIPDIYERISPAVISITATSINPYQLTERVSRVMGSGVIIDPSGLVLTNSHVVYGRQTIMVTLDDGTLLPAKLKGADPLFDLAVLQIEPPTAGQLPVATLGNQSRIRVGDEVVAIGNPMGLEQTLTRGIVSAINRILPDAPFYLKEPMIQTDAPINPGNSGGPLLDLCGEVIGITTAILPEAQNIGFAVPVDLIKSVLPSLVREGRVIRPWIGIQGQLVSPPLKELLRIPLVDGLLVETVEPGSPAERLGLHGGALDVVVGGQALLLGGDIVTNVNGAPIGDPQKLTETMRPLKVGDTVRLTLFRAGHVREVELVLPERPTQPGDLPGQRPTLPLVDRQPRRPGYRL